MFFQVREFIDYICCPKADMVLMAFQLSKHQSIKFVVIDVVSSSGLRAMVVPLISGGLTGLSAPLLPAQIPAGYVDCILSSASLALIPCNRPSQSWHDTVCSLSVLFSSSISFMIVRVWMDIQPYILVSFFILSQWRYTSLIVKL